MLVNLDFLGSFNGAEWGKGVQINTYYVVKRQDEFFSLNIPVQSYVKFLRGGFSVIKMYTT